MTQQVGNETFSTFTVQGDDTALLVALAQKIEDDNPGVYGSRAEIIKMVINSNNAFLKVPASQRPPGWHLIVNAGGGWDCVTNKDVHNSWPLHKNQTVYFKPVANEPTYDEVYYYHCHHGKPPQGHHVDGKPPASPETGPVEFFDKPTVASDGTRYQHGSMLHALYSYARFNHPELLALRDIAARGSVKVEKDAGQTAISPDTSAFEIEGPNTRPFGSSPMSAVDDSHLHIDGTTGGGEVHDLLHGYAARAAYPFGFATVDAANGDYVRKDHMDWPVFAHGGHYATADYGGVQLTQVLGLPVGLVWSNPQHQTPVYSYKDRIGISRSVAALAQVNFSGFNNLFRDEQAQLTDPLVPANVIGAKMYAENAAMHFNDALGDFEKTHNTDKAVEAAVAWRDLCDNRMIRQVDALRIPLDQDRLAVRNYFVREGVPADVLDKALATAPRLKIVDMTQDKLNTAQDYWLYKHTDRYNDIHPGQGGANFDAYEQDAYPSMNWFEKQRAVGDDRGLNEAAMIAEQRTAAQILMKSDDVLRSTGTVLTTNQAMQDAVGTTLAAYLKNPQLGGFKTRDEALDFAKKFVGDNKEALEQLTRTGETAFHIGGTLPVPFLQDEPFSMTRPDVFGKAAGAAVAANPDLMRQLLERTSNPAIGLDDKGRNDSRRDMRSILQALGSQYLAPGAKEGDLPANYAAVTARLAKEDETIVRRATLDASNYVQDGILGLQGTHGRAMINTDNLLARAQADQTGARFNSGLVDATEVDAAVHSGDTSKLWDALFNGQKARDDGRGQVRVLGLQASNSDAQDAILETILRNPGSFKNVIAQLRAKADSNVTFQRYDTLADVLEDTSKLAAKGDYKGAVGTWGEFWTDAAARRDGSASNLWTADMKGGLHESAWQAMIELAGNDGVSDKIVGTVADDKPLMDRLLKGSDDAVAALHNGVRVSNGPLAVPTDVNSQFYALPTTTHKGNTRIDDGGLLSFIGLFHRDVTVNDAALAGIGLMQGLKPGQPAPAVATGAPTPTGTPAASTNAAAVQPLTAAQIAASVQRNQGESDADYAARVDAAVKAANAVQPPAGANNGQPIAVGTATVPADVAAAATRAANNVSLQQGQMGNVLNTNPIIYAPSSKGQSAAEVLAAQFKASGLKIPADALRQGVTYLDIATASIASGDYTAKGTPEGFLFGTAKATDSPEIADTVNVGAHLTVAVGIAKSWIPFFFHHGKPPELGHGGPGGCPIVPDPFCHGPVPGGGGPGF